MPNQQLKLSTHQQQVLADLGLDAWYLAPPTGQLSHTQQAKITEIVESLSASLQVPDSENRSISTSEVSASSVAAVESKSQILRKKRDSLPPTIQLAVNQAIVPDNTAVMFPAVEPLTTNTWQAVDLAMNQLSDDSEAAIKGFGNTAADWLFVMPPALPQENQPLACLDLKTKQLFTEWLASLGRSIDEVYATPLIKCAMKIPRDPDNAVLAKHLPILLAELALVQPQQIFLMGRLPSQALLSTTAPLSLLMKKTYELSDSFGFLQPPCPLTCLPALDYFLAVPLQKSWLWQVSKKFVMS